MARKTKEIDFEAEYQQHLTRVRARVGAQVPLSRVYTQGEQPILVSIDGETATLRFRNGAELVGVPLRDLVYDAGYWK